MNAYRAHSDALVERLRDPIRAQQYLDVALDEYEADGDLGAFLLALRRVIEARGGVEKIAADAHLNVETVASILSADSKPPFESIDAILRALGFGLSVKCRVRVG